MSTQNFLILLLLAFASTSSAFAPQQLRQIVPTASTNRRTNCLSQHHALPNENETISYPSKNNDNTSNNRRSFLSTATASVWVTCATTFHNPTPAHATYGADAKIVMPDVVQGIADRTNKQCLVESLGNRECLVYLDPENQLYKGSDAQVLFERLAKSVDALKNIPQYVDTKQWSKVQGILTGPMGSLSSTMNEFVKVTENEAVKDKCKTLSVEIRKELYAIAGAVDRKNQKEALVAYEKAVEKLEKFVTLISG